MVGALSFTGVVSAGLAAFCLLTQSAILLGVPADIPQELGYCLTDMR